MCGLTRAPARGGTSASSAASSSDVVTLLEGLDLNAAPFTAAPQTLEGGGGAHSPGVVVRFRLLEHGVVHLSSAEGRVHAAVPASPLLRVPAECALEALVAAASAAGVQVTVSSAAGSGGRAAAPPLRFGGGPPSPWGAAATAPSPRAAAPRPLPRVLVLVGLPGSGKSTAAQELVAAHADWARVNQDELGDRRACEAAASAALASGRSVVIDRCNFDAAQRATWLRIASDAGLRSRCSALFFDVPAAECARRASARRGHPTLAPASAAAVVAQMSAGLRPPVAAEGFADVHTVASAAHARAVIARLVGS